MKRICFFLIIAALFAGNIAAQDVQQGQRGNRQPRDQQQPVKPAKPETVSVTGTLQLQNGYIALVSGENVYRVPALTRLAGFVDGVKEGKQVTVEGLGAGKVIRASKLTVDGKSYDFPEPRRGQGKFGNAPQGFGPKQFAPPPRGNQGYGKNNRGSCCGRW
jgi:hypothetical protein